MTKIVLLTMLLSGCTSLTPQDFVGTWVFDADAAVSGACNGTPSTNTLAGQQMVFALDKAGDLTLVQPTCTLQFVVAGTKAVLLPNQQCSGPGAAQMYELYDAFELTGIGLVDTISGTVTFADRVCTDIHGGGTLDRRAN